MLQNLFPLSFLVLPWRFVAHRRYPLGRQHHSGTRHNCSLWIQDGHLLKSDIPFCVGWGSKACCAPVPHRWLVSDLKFCSQFMRLRPDECVNFCNFKYFLPFLIHLNLSPSFKPVLVQSLKHLSYSSSVHPYSPPSERHFWSHFWLIRFFTCSIMPPIILSSAKSGAGFWACTSPAVVLAWEWWHAIIRQIAVISANFILIHWWMFLENIDWIWDLVTSFI